MKKTKKDIEVASETIQEWSSRVLKELLTELGIGGTTLYVSRGKKQSEAMFEIIYRSEYKTGYVHYYNEAEEVFQERRYDLLIQSITHEVCHVLVGKIDDLARDRYVNEKQIINADEELTETIAQLLRKYINLKNKDLFKIN